MTVDDLQEYLDECGVEFFDADEIVKRHAGFPPPELWPNIIPTLKVLDAVRASMGTPFTVTSGYRSPEYNRSIGGAPHSLHVEFCAVDIWVRNRTPAEVKKAIDRVLGPLFVAQFMGVGVYPNNNFLHADTRGLTQDMAGGSWVG
jgi:uncharacterized protein YcbK (DUF882 family)